jgi:hypothetical protein
MTEHQTEEQETFRHTIVVAAINIVPNPIENTGDAITHYTCQLPTSIISKGIPCFSKKQWWQLV